MNRDIAKIISNYNKPFYGGFIITRHNHSYKHSDENPTLIIIDTDKNKILTNLKKYCKNKIRFDKYLKPGKYIRIGICITKLEFGSIIKELEWDQCQGYFNNFDKLDKKKI